MFNSRLLTIFVFVWLGTACSVVHAWGSKSIPNSRRPVVGWERKFPSSPTVVVRAGESVIQAIRQCSSIVGNKGYCTVQIVGNPSDKTITIDRSRTKLTSTGAEITSSGAVTFIALNRSWLRNVVVENLNIKGHRASEVFGIYVRGANIRGVIIRNNNIYGFNGDDNAHGIAVYGTGAKPVSHVLIDSNEVYNMRTGYSESIVVNGNVNKWAIANNFVHDVNNIAIDAIGGEGTYPPSASARFPRNTDGARNGFIEYNTVERMSTRTNPAYGNLDSWAAGIYVDGARQILIQGNTIDDSPWGIEVGAENCVITRDVIVRNNEVTKSFYGDFLTGGYNPTGYLVDSSIQCNPLKTADTEEGHGYVQRITVRNNDFKTTTGREQNVLAQYRTTYAIIAEPGISPVNQNGDGSATGDENAIRTS